MKRRTALFLVCAALFGCAPAASKQDKPGTREKPAEALSAQEPTAKAESAPASQPASQPASAQTGTAPGSERAFGAALKAPGEPVAVATVLADPAPYLGKVVKAEGTVARVCERAGCWLELASGPNTAGLRVPMANHAFFIPPDAVGRPAIVEGELSAQALPESHRAHLASEGAKSLGPLFLQATGVVVR